MKKKGLKIKKKIQRKKGLSGLINTILLVLVAIVIVSIVFAVSIDFFKKKSQISQARVDLIEEKVRIKNALIDPEDPSKISLTFCCAEGTVFGSKSSTSSWSSGGGGSGSDAEPLDIGLVIDRSDSMIQAGWTLDISPSLIPLLTFENIEIEEGEYSQIVNFDIPLGTERIAVLVEWAELDGHYGSKGSEFGPNIKPPSSNWEFGQNKPNVDDKVDPPSNLGDADVYFSGISTLPEIVYVENPEEGNWEFRVYGIGFKPSDNKPAFQYVNITVYVGTAAELIRNPTIISLEAAKEASKELVLMMGDEDRMSVTMFAKDSVLLNSLTDSKATILNSIDLIVKQPNTQINEGLDLSRNDFDSNARPGAKKIMILLTDGQNDEGPTPVINSAQLIKEDEIEIYSIGLSGFVDEEMLKQISSYQENYYFVSDASKLAEIFNSVGGKIFSSGQSVSLSDGFKLIFYNETHVYSPDSSVIDLKPYQTKTYTFDLEDNLINIQKVEIYPIKVVYGEEIVGPLVETHIFK